MLQKYYPVFTASTAWTREPPRRFGQSVQLFPRSAGVDAVRQEVQALKGGRDRRMLSLKLGPQQQAADRSG